MMCFCGDSKDKSNNKTSSEPEVDEYDHRSRLNLPLSATLTPQKKLSHAPQPTETHAKRLMVNGSWYVRAVDAEFLEGKVSELEEELERYRTDDAETNAPKAKSLEDALESARSDTAEVDTLMVTLSELEEKLERARNDAAEAGPLRAKVLELEEAVVTVSELEEKLERARNDAAEAGPLRAKVLELEEAVERAHNDAV